MKSQVALTLAVALSSILTLACDRTPETPKVDTSTTGSAPASGDSVALPQSAMPRSDAAIPPPAGASGQQSSGDADSATQANPTQLQKSQEQAAMPMSGQANNHSVPEAGGQQK